MRRTFTRRTYERGIAAARAGRARVHDEGPTEEDLAALAPRVGFCQACEVRVDEARGVLHAPTCQWAPADRRAS